MWFWKDSLLGVHLIQDKVLECSCRPYLEQAFKYEKDSLFGITATGTGTKGRWARARISCARHRHHGGITIRGISCSLVLKSGVNFSNLIQVEKRCLELKRSHFTQ